ncbi:glycosyltransferase family protein [Serpentinicella sp. ANB-PHB4]|uniref:glycosyltransferase family protein n=1 Tax=Serpentinicella sp. ANB-PHB4 TaxID=3074076 RepID=UPI00286379BA|nr:glycosyltransferase family protein [Serpentinicella sp. ANB-PHB4]MDR5659781.1 glycosyltransferase family protein [Serpentinicella sp. ANB-PHB4]
MKIGAIIQARMGSSRLPGKVMKKLKGKTVLQHVIDRVKQSKMIDEIVIATTVHERDDAIENEALNCGVKVYKGNEEDVLSRYYYAAKENEIDIILRITSDCPLIDPFIMDSVITNYLKGDYDIVTNAGSDLSQRTFPRGLDIEIFSDDILKKAFNNAKQTYQREHVTPYIYEHSEKIFYHKNDINYSNYRLTLDTEEDFELITQIYNRLYKGKHDFYLNELIELIIQEPALYYINSQIKQKKLK